MSESEKKELLGMASKEFEDELTDEIEKIEEEDKELQEKIQKAKDLVSGDNNG